MPSTYTSNGGIEKIGLGEKAGAWGTTTNTNFDIIDRLDNIEEWDEVVEIANLIFDQDKETMEQQQSESEDEDPQGSFDFNIPMTGQQQAEWDDEDSIELTLEDVQLAIKRNNSELKKLIKSYIDVKQKEQIKKK